MSPHSTALLICANLARTEHRHHICRGLRAHLHLDTTVRASDPLPLLICHELNAPTANASDPLPLVRCRTVKPLTAAVDCWRHGLACAPLACMLGVGTLLHSTIAFDVRGRGRTHKAGPDPARPEPV